MYEKFDSSGCFERHPKTGKLFRIEHGWRDHKGRPAILFPAGLGKDQIETGIDYEFLVEGTSRYYVMQVEGRPIAHRIMLARRFAINGEQIVPPEEWEAYR